VVPRKEEEEEEEDLETRHDTQSTGYIFMAW
jgi:hypothetical protein